MTSYQTSEFIHHSVKEFRIIYDKLIQIGLSHLEICTSSNLAYATVNTLIKDQAPRVRASTLGRIQEFIKAYNTQTLKNEKFRKFLIEGEHKTVSIPDGTQKSYISKAAVIVKEKEVSIEGKGADPISGAYAEERGKEERDFFSLLKKLYEIMPDNITINLEINAPR